MNEDVTSLRDYLIVLRRQRWVVMSTIVFVVVVSVGISLAQVPVYEAMTDVAVERVRATQDVSLEDLLGVEGGGIATEQIVMSSRAVADRVAANLGLLGPAEALEGVSVQSVGSTRVLRIVVVDDDPAAAASKADAFADAYLEFRRDQALDEIIAARANIEERAASVRAQIAEVDELLEEVDGDEAESLAIQREALLVQLGQVSAQAGEFTLEAQDITGGGVVLTPAEVPSSPVAPQPLRIGVLALALGLMLGVVLAFLRDYLDDVIRDEEDFKRATGGRPLLGRIPHWQQTEGEERLATLVDPSSLVSESYRELSVGVRFLMVTRDAARVVGDDADVPLARSLMIVSVNAGEGKSVTAANLAIAAARVGLITVLVDADLRRATLHRRFGLARGTGLSDAIIAQGAVDEHLADVGVENLWFLSAGSLPPNPAELLASTAMRRIQRYVGERADLVIYDTPATLAVPDALELGRYVDIAILVGRAGLTSRRELSSAIERLEQVGTDVAGTVLNDIDRRSDGYYYVEYSDRPDADDPTGDQDPSVELDADVAESAHDRRVSGRNSGRERRRDERRRRRTMARRERHREPRSEEQRDRRGAQRRQAPEAVSSGPSPDDWQGDGSVDTGPTTTDTPAGQASELRDQPHQVPLPAPPPPPVAPPPHPRGFRSTAYEGGDRVAVDEDDTLFGP